MLNLNLCVAFSVGFNLGYKENLSLYGYPDGTWDVQEARMLLPPNLPEPTVGINLARDRMRAIDWVTVVAEHCDSWLLSLAFLFGVGLSHDDRYNYGFFLYLKYN